MSDPHLLLTSESRDAARRLALDWFDRVVVTSSALHAEPDDPETLHQLRVALTRLRGTLRSYRTPLEPGIGRRGERKLRGLNRTLGRVRDLDVRIAHLADLEALPPDARDGAEQLRARLGEARPESLRQARAALDTVLADHLPCWTSTLTHYTVPRTVGEPSADEPFAATVAAVLGEAVRVLTDHLALAREDSGHDGFHAARLAVKRVRALLHPWRDDVPACGPAFAAASTVQDLLGDMRDAQLLAREARRAAEHAAKGEKQSSKKRRSADSKKRRSDSKEQRNDSKEQRNAEAIGSLEALARHADERARQLRTRFTDEWLARDADALVAEATEAVHAFAALATPDREIERKFLLHAVPPRVRDVPAVRIAQGWLPGERLRERLRRTVHPDGRVEWTRTVKVGTGMSRMELEEPAEPVLFESLWPLTAAARVHKTRQTVSDGLLTWEIDVFLDRDLVLAEVELPSENTPVTLPDWLAPYVEREVTGDPVYVNANLARRNGQRSHTPGTAPR